MTADLTMRIERIHYPPGAPDDTLFVWSGTGEPVMPLTRYYTIRGRGWHPQRGGRSTRETYTTLLVPILAYLAEHDVPWNAPPEHLRPALIGYLRAQLGCQVTPMRAPGGGVEAFRVTATSSSPVAPSTIRVTCAALRDLYQVLVDDDLYGYPNPLVSEVRAVRAAAARDAIENRGAPDNAGIRGIERGRQRVSTALLACGAGGSWHPDATRMIGTLLDGARADLLAMQAYLPPALADYDPARAPAHLRRAMALVLRDRAVIGLLMYTGARIHEIVGMTAGGYRAPGLSGWAKIRNKGSRGLEEKMITFAATPAQDALAAYLAHGRTVLDPHGSRRIADLAAEDAIFLDMRGRALTPAAFTARWHRLLRAVRADGPDAPAGGARLTPHDVRHWYVTRFLLHARDACAGSAAGYAEAKARLTRALGWRSPATVDVYNHALDELEGWADMALFQQMLAHPATSESAATGVPSAGGNAAPASIAPDIEIPDRALSLDDLAWLDEQCLVL